MGDKEVLALESSAISEVHLKKHSSSRVSLDSLCDSYSSILEHTPIEDDLVINEFQ